MGALAEKALVYIMRRHPQSFRRSRDPWSVDLRWAYLLIGLKETVALGLLVFIDVSQQLVFLRPVLLMLPLLQLCRQTKLWYNYVKRFGAPSINAIRKMWKLDAMRAYKGFTFDSNKRGYVFEYLAVFWAVAGAFCLLWVYTGITPFLYVAIMFTTLSIKRLIRLARPPALLFLAPSSLPSTKLQLEIMRKIYPLELVSCTLHTEMLPNELLYFYSYRTAEEAVWKDTIRALIALSQITVIDVRDTTQAVDFEIDVLLKTADTDRVFFIGTSTHDTRVPSIRCVTEKELMEALCDILSLSSRDKAENEMGFSRESPTEDQQHPRQTEEPPGVSVHSQTSMADKRAVKKLLYTDKNGYFCFLPPQAWIRRDFPNDPRSKVQFECPSSEGVLIRFIAEVASPELNRDNILDAVHTQMEVARAQLPASLDQEIRGATFAGFPSAHVHQSLPFFMEQEVIIFVATGIQFSIAYDAPNRSFLERHRKLVQDSLDTFTLGKSIPSPNLGTQAQKHLVARKLRLAQISTNIGDFENARRRLEEGLEEYPQNADLKQALTLVRQKRPLPNDLGPSSQSKQCK